jgi:hypothetical protein
MENKKTFPSQQVVTVAGTSINVVNRWLSRELWPEDLGGFDVTKPSKGRERRFTFFAVMQLAIAVELTHRGVDVKEAIKYGFKFAHMGSAYAVFGNNKPDPDKLRPIGGLFPTGKTCFICGGRTSRCELIQIIDWKDQFQDILYSVSDDGNYRGSYSTVDVNAIWARVTAELDYTPILETDVGLKIST